MKKIGKLLLVTFIGAFLSNAVLAEDKDTKGPKVYATVNENQVAIGQTVLFNVIVESSGDGESIGEPRLPDLQGLELVSRSSGIESRSEFINGQFTFVKKQIYSYYLSPTKEGTVTLGSAEVIVGDKSLKTQPITIKVEKGSVAQRPTPRNQAIDEEDPGTYDPFEEADKIFDQLLRRNLPRAQQDTKINPDEAFFIRVETDKDKVYAGEQVTATWYLYTKNNLTNFEPIKYPELKGFWKEDIEISLRLNFENVVINGIPYRKALLVSYALFPIKAGVATIDSYKLRATAYVTSGLGVFGRPFTFTKTNTPVKLNVLPIPSQNQPADFTGAVGHFDLKAQAEKTTVPVNEPFTFKLRFDGRGNAKQIELPALNLSDKFEQYDTKEDSKFFKDGTSYKEFEILLIPRSVGELEIPSVSVSFFNPNTRQFEQKTTQAIKLNVVQGKNLGQANSQSFLGSDEKVAKAKNVLPDPVIEVPMAFITRGFLIKLWTGLGILTLILCILIVIKNLRTTGAGQFLEKEFSKRYSTIAKKMDDNLREAAVHTLNLSHFVLAEITQDKENHVVEELIRKLSPGYKEKLNENFYKSIKFFETLAFAPLEITRNLQDPKRFKEELKIVKSSLTEIINVHVKNG